MENSLESSSTSLELELFQSEKKFSTMFQLSPVGMAIFDGETGAFLEVNDAVLGAIGYTKEELMNLSYWDITPKEYKQQELQQLKDLEAAGRFGPNQKEYIRADGTRCPISISGVALTDVRGRKIILGIIEDISERMAHEKKLEAFALYDPLTHLPNRRLLSERLNLSMANSIREEKSLAVLMLDLDKFKDVNDTFGHGVGDELLKEAAQRLVRMVRRKTDTVARLGGDEFAVLLPLITDRQDVVKIAQDCCKALSEPFLIEENTILISSSIGIALFPEHGDDERALLANADIALYQVKKSKRGTFKIFAL
jgi:diguanylate cyclase (GGDEF)-like protein/PAS domain S-box-containing protein